MLPGSIFRYFSIYLFIFLIPCVAIYFYLLDIFVLRILYTCH